MSYADALRKVTRIGAYGLLFEIMLYCLPQKGQWLLCRALDLPGGGIELAKLQKRLKARIFRGGRMTFSSLKLLNIIVLWVSFLR